MDPAESNANALIFVLFDRGVLPSLFRNGRSFLVLPHAFGVLFFMARITAGNQLPLPVPIVIYVILRECKLWMSSHMVDMVHYSRPRVYSLILAELAFVFIFRQHFRPQAQPLCTGIEAMQVPALYARLDINAHCPSSVLMSLARSRHMGFSAAILFAVPAHLVK